ncbi:MAG: metallophosphoesterase [Nanoarchaeota archaeon]
MTKFLIIGDLHGKKPKIYTKDFDAIIAPGDFCSDNLRKYMFRALKKEIETGEEYWWYNLISKSKAKKEIIKSLKDGRKILEFLNSFNKPIFALPGNWDWTGRDEDWKYLHKNYWKSYLIKGLNNIRNTHKNIFKFKDLTIVGHGITSGPEYPVKERSKSMSNAEIKESKENYKRVYFNPMNKLFNKARKYKSPIIFLTHNIPYNTKLDKILDKKSPRVGQHFGSYLARQLIEKHKPLVSIGGHMHEHFGKDKIKNTTIINAGFGSYVNTIMEIKNNKIKNLEFIRNNKKI